MGYNSQHPIGLTNWVTTDPIRNILEPSAPVSYDVFFFPSFFLSFINTV